MTPIRHIDFEPADWGEFANPPVAWSGYADRVLALNPIAYWRFGETGGGVAVDLVGNASGTYVGSVALGQPGVLKHDDDGSAGFNGSDSLVDLGSAPLLDGKSAGTVMFWMKYTGPSVTADGAVLARWPDPSLSGWMLWVDDLAYYSKRRRTMSFAMDILEEPLRLEGSTDLIIPGSWDFYAVTFESGVAMRLYKNAALDAQRPLASVSMPVTTAASHIGFTDGTVGHLPAGLDELAVFDTAMTAEQIAAFYDLGRGVLNLPAAGGL